MSSLVNKHLELQKNVRPGLVPVPPRSTVLVHTGPMGSRVRGRDSSETLNVAYSQFVFVQFAMLSIKEFEPECCGNILSHIYFLLGTVFWRETCL